MSVNETVLYQLIVNSMSLLIFGSRQMQLVILNIVLNK